MSASERARRNAQIAARRADGLTLAQLAQEFGVARSTVQKALADHAAAGAVSDAINVEAIIGDGLRAHQAALRRVTELLAHEHPQSAIGAANSITRLLTSFVQNLKAVGVLGDSELEAERARIAREARELGEQMAAAVDSFQREVHRVASCQEDDEVGAALREAADEVVAVFDRAIGVDGAVSGTELELSAPRPLELVR